MSDETASNRPLPGDLVLYHDRHDSGLGMIWPIIKKSKRNDYWFVNSAIGPNERRVPAGSPGICIARLPRELEVGEINDELCYFVFAETIGWQWVERVEKVTT